ncbi:MAG: transposase [Planctomycetaceae bacterium]|nr:transposase [Planctomycetaceae bacterium]
MAGVRLAAPQKKARRQGAPSAWIDETGLLRAPLARRTWATQGQTPDLAQKGATREKVSVAAALGLSPRRDRLGLDSRTLANGSFESWSGAVFLEAMLRGLAGRFVVVWDGGPMHKGDPIRDRVDPFSARLSLERLPPCAPMLNPIEVLWSWLKWERLSHFGPRDAHELDGRVIAELAAVREDQAFLRDLFHASDLPLPRALLF